jgi:hypothetical protein
MMVPGWYKVKNGAKYADVSERTFEDWLKQGLKYVQIPSGLRLVKPEWIDQFLEQFIQEVQPSSQANKSLKEVMREAAKELVS